MNLKGFKVAERAAKEIEEAFKKGGVIAAARRMYCFDDPHPSQHDVAFVDVTYDLLWERGNIPKIYLERLKRARPLKRKVT